MTQAWGWKRRYPICIISECTDRMIIVLATYSIAFIMIKTLKKEGYRYSTCTCTTIIQIYPNIFGNHIECLPLVWKCMGMPKLAKHDKVRLRRLFPWIFIQAPAAIYEIARYGYALMRMELMSLVELTTRDTSTWLGKIYIGANGWSIFLNWSSVTETLELRCFSGSVLSAPLVSGEKDPELSTSERSLSFKCSTICKKHIYGLQNWPQRGWHNRDFHCTFQHCNVNGHFQSKVETLFK